jgi:hypothetical protein
MEVLLNGFLGNPDAVHQSQQESIQHREGHKGGDKGCQHGRFHVDFPVNIDDRIGMERIGYPWGKKNEKRKYQHRHDQV